MYLQVVLKAAIKYVPAGRSKGDYQNMCLQVVLRLSNMCLKVVLREAIKYVSASRSKDGYQICVCKSF